jgi:hypothetical protein
VEGTPLGGVFGPDEGFLWEVLQEVPMTERDAHGKFLSVECWENLERRQITENLATGWERALENLRKQIEPLRGRHYGKRKIEEI